MTEDEIKSEAFSFEGWDVWSWFKGNWSTIKELLKVGSPAVLGWVLTQHPAWTGLITIGGKAVIDIIEYYVKKR